MRPCTPSVSNVSYVGDVRQHDASRDDSGEIHRGQEFMCRAESAARHFSARHSMKLVAFFLALGVFEVMSVMLIAMSSNASAQSSVATGTRSVSLGDAPVSVPPANLIAGRIQNDPESMQSEVSRKNAKKRSRKRCARITTTCWNAA